MNLDKNILEKYNQGNANEQERALVESWFDQFSINEPLQDEEILGMLNSLDGKVLPVVENTGTPWLRIFAIAASLLCVCALSYYWFVFKDSSANQEEVLAQYESPKTASPIIVLEDNKEFNIDSLVKGDTLNAGNYLITKLPNGELKYIIEDETTEVIYNTVRTKSGSTASLQLSDGSHVWLNVNSEIKYPIHFSSNKREIHLKGEGYFDIEHQEKSGVRIPFYVRGEEYTIAVLGTKFNADFSKNNVTALIAGKVAIAKGQLNTQVEHLSFDVNLSPNQVYNAGRVSFAEDIYQYLDWKEGYFSLTNRTLETVAEKISDWYGLDVVVDESIKRNVLLGRINRRKTLKEVLSVISAAIPLKYKIEDNVLYLKEPK
ncbi:DUF4974 domain-containing protein [Sphingobacterium sp. DK4209]|uniref:DUF4974 domain-containing protein n=1 Tax=Sphingobacterium zhuxiongii TaxID=2662364 RepID=A0A5Q0Q6K8_9SPHI|nr:MULTISPECIES: FecR family protein [unclassified Sphingobacterium]MVZ66324.1 DUF4974 domain-containing protein [Sphingobacterium sp. DK4209]QGA25103.1 DUF4974 domain-containing protein [Sphingobacterium sp. dk4302]